MATHGPERHRWAGCRWRYEGPPRLERRVRPLGSSGSTSCSSAGTRRKRRSEGRWEGRVGGWECVKHPPDCPPRPARRFETLQNRPRPQESCHLRTACPTQGGITAPPRVGSQPRPRWGHSPAHGGVTAPPTVGSQPRPLSNYSPAHRAIISCRWQPQARLAGGFAGVHVRVSAGTGSQGSTLFTPVFFVEAVCC